MPCVLLLHLHDSQFRRTTSHPISSLSHRRSHRNRNARQRTECDTTNWHSRTCRDFSHSGNCTNCGNWRTKNVNFINCVCVRLRAHANLKNIHFNFSLSFVLWRARARGTAIINASNEDGWGCTYAVFERKKTENDSLKFHALPYGMCWDVQKPARQCAMLGYGWRIGSRHAAHIVTEIKLRFNLRGRALALARAHTEMAHGFTNQLMMNTKAHNVINSFCRRLSRQLIGIPHTHTHIHVIHYQI